MRSYYTISHAALRELENLKTLLGGSSMSLKYHQQIQIHILDLLWLISKLRGISKLSRILRKGLKIMASKFLILLLL